MTSRRPKEILLLGSAWLSLFFAGCSPPRHDAIDHTDYSDDGGDSYSSEADRTREMEAKANDMNAGIEDAMDNAQSEQDLTRAYQEFEASRQELNEMSDSDEYAPEP